jgi:hypothetical protein
MKAHGLEDMSYAKALIRKVLVEGTVADENSFANKLADSRYKDFAKTSTSPATGETATSFDRARKGTIEKLYAPDAGDDRGRARIPACASRSISSARRRR